MGEGIVPYTRYVEANQQILRIPGYNEDVLLMVIPNSEYWDRVPIRVRTRIIGEVISAMTPREAKEADEVWWQAYYSLIIAQKSGVVSGSDVSAINVKSIVTTTKNIKVPLFGTIGAKGITKIKGHLKHIHLIAVPLEQGFSGSVVVTNSYAEVKAGSNRVGLYWSCMYLCIIFYPGYLYGSLFRTMNMETWWPNG